MKAAILAAFAAFSVNAVSAEAENFDPKWADEWSPGATGAYGQASHDGTTPILRMRMDAASRGWILTKTGVAVFDFKARRTVRLVEMPDWQWAGEPYGCQPDLALGPKGEAVVSSDVLPALWRVDPETLEVSQHALALDADAGKDIGFSRLEYSAGQNAYVGVSSVHGSVWRIDPQLGRAQKLAQSAPQAQACRTGETPQG